ncbi:MAG: Eco57I restriction-modification methylase domain-containing protein [Candidatus Promineifilaceae bacterium]
MNERTIRLIKQTFNEQFDLNRYRQFTQELLNRYEEKPFTNSGNIIPQGYRDHVALFGRIGTYTDPDQQTIDILYIKLRHPSHLRRARTFQRNLVARHLKLREKDAALVAFYADGSPDWRFSLVWRSEEMRFDEVKDRLRFEEDLSPSRRSSFLVGKFEPSHTAQRQLLPILANDRHAPTLDALQIAFSVETVTREFFDQYKELFLQITEALEHIRQTDSAVEANFTQKEIETSDFAKKLMGQIVFLYFLQKKGWLGVAKDANWGDGSPQFMRQLFDDTQHYDNFFNDILEPLFYESLAVEHPNDFYEPFGVRMPFLNGGLFSPMNGYDWRGTVIKLPNELFSNTIVNRAGDVGTGVLNVFDRYNFTVQEEAPLDQEVAVDPEMLGKVFENLLEVTNRKSQGAFYTPREIVHYMCQESLIDYLDDVANREEQRVPRTDIEFLVRQGEMTLADEVAQQLGRKREGIRLSQSVRDHVDVLDQALLDIKVCDPAIGSGAFPVGMLHEIVAARRALAVVRLAQLPTDLGYQLKRHAIQNSLYGVDREVGAVEIAKLRLWLSLIVEEDDYREPLPNLGYKIVCGDSVSGGVSTHTLLNEADRQQLRQLKRDYFVVTSPQRKVNLQARIDVLLDRLMPDGKFDFGAYFDEIWLAGRNGFDVVIGNPPYVRHELIRRLKPDLKKNFPTIYAGTADLYVYFYARGLELLRENGTLAYITSNKFMRAGYGKKIRNYLSHQTVLQTIIDFGDLPVFDATAYPVIVMLRSTQPTGGMKTKVLTVDSLDILTQLPYQVKELSWEVPQSDFSSSRWTLVHENLKALLEKMNEIGHPLERYVDGQFYRGIVTGADKIFVISHQIRNELIAEDPTSKEIIRPWLRGRDIQKWEIAYNDWFVIFTRRGIDIDKYPAIKRYLSGYRTQLEPKPKNWPKHKHWEGRKTGSYQWYEIQDNIAYYPELEKTKLVYQKFQVAPRFAFDRDAYYVNSAIWMLISDDISLLAILNSTVGWFLIQNYCTQIQRGYQLIWEYFKHVPIVGVHGDLKLLLEGKVSKLLARPSLERVLELEREINELVYKLYQLEADEIALVEENVVNATRKNQIESATQAINKLKGRK